MTDSLELERMEKWMAEVHRDYNSLVNVAWYTTLIPAVLDSKGQWACDLHRSPIKARLLLQEEREEKNLVCMAITMVYKPGNVAEVAGLLVGQPVFVAILANEKLWLVESDSVWKYRS